jgi:hypothetical protein
MPDTKQEDSNRIANYTSAIFENGADWPSIDVRGTRFESREGFSWQMPVMKPLDVSVSVIWI